MKNSLRNFGFVMWIHLYIFCFDAYSTGYFFVPQEPRDMARFQ